MPAECLFQLPFHFKFIGIYHLVNNDPYVQQDIVFKNFGALEKAVSAAIHHYFQARRCHVEILLCSKRVTIQAINFLI